MWALLYISSFRINFFYNQANDNYFDILINNSLSLHGITRSKELVEIFCKQVSGMLIFFISEFGGLTVI